MARKIFDESGKGVYACDFETYVSEDTASQQETHVWSSACVELAEGKAVKICDSFPKMLERISLEQEQGDTITLYFHNLKFDGVFILDWLLKQGREFVKYNATSNDGKPYFNRNALNNKQYTCSISDLGSYYTIDFKAYGLIWHVVDSFKLVPLKLEKAGKGFNTQHQKTEMKYTGNKTIWNISDKDREYIMNDVLVLKEVLMYMFNEGHMGLTIGACCMTEFKSQYGGERWREMFPNLTEYKAGDTGLTQFDYCSASYRGGWCYVNDEIANKTLHNGKNYDANSHYPSVMIEPGNMFPLGIGTYYKAESNRFEEQCERRLKNPNWYWFVRFRCEFTLKEEHYPFIQIKGNPFYNGRHMLKTSIPERFQGYDKIQIGEEIFDSRPIITLTCKDWELFQESYDIKNLEVLDCLVFQALEGDEIFGEYINKYMKMKVQAGKEGNGAMKQIAKLFLNNLYGKFGAKPNSSYKVPRLDENGKIKYDTVEEYNKTPGYMAIGSAITSYARCRTVSLANENFHHFAYSDTDSIHLFDCPEGFEFKGVKIDPDEFGAWANENDWDEARFLRAKTYCEHMTHKDGKKLDNPVWVVKAAGMTDEGKEKCVEKILKNGCGWYTLGIQVNGLKPVMINGGVLLRETSFTIK